MKTTTQPQFVRLHHFEAAEYLQMLLEHVRENVRQALTWKTRYAHLGPTGYADYIGWAKRDAEKARVLARRIKVPFGRESVAERQARQASIAARLEHLSLEQARRVA